MRNITRALAATACAAVIGIRAAAPALAGTITSVPTIGNLLGKGAAVAVTVSGTCDVGMLYAVSDTITEKQGRLLLQGYGSTGWKMCVEENFTEPVFVSSYDPNRQLPAFKKGTAALNVTFQICDFNYENCTYLSKVSE